MSNRVLAVAVPILSLVLTLACGGGGGNAGNPPVTPPPTPTPVPAAVTFVRQNAHAIESLDLDYASSSDLAFLEPVLQGRDIVELGESGHGVAEFSQAKIRLIKYLHEALGYDVLVFESSILSTYLNNDRAPQLTPKQFMQDAIFAVWSTEDVAKLFAYIQSTQNTQHPLILAGMDIQLTSPYEMDVRPSLFQEVVARFDPVYAQQIYELDTTFAANQYDSQYILANHSDLKTKYQALTVFLDAHTTELQSIYADRPLFPMIVRQAAWGMIANIDELYSYAQGQLLVASNARDQGMATNLIALIDDLYPNRKVMVWGHNAHLVHDASAVGSWNWNNTGKWIFQKYRSRVYTLGLYMYRGSAADNSRNVYAIPPASPGSVEGLLHEAGAPYVFLDLAGVEEVNDGTAWLFTSSPIRDWGQTNSSMVLKDQYDGLLQIDVVHPPAYVE